DRAVPDVLESVGVGHGLLISYVEPGERALPGDGDSDSAGIGTGRSGGPVFVGCRQPRAPLTNRPRSIDCQSHVSHLGFPPASASARHTIVGMATSDAVGSSTMRRLVPGVTDLVADLVGPRVG